MPSPYGTHRPTTTVAFSAASAANSCASRDLPIPAVPRIVNRCSVCSSATRAKAPCSRPSSRLRPTSGDFSEPTAGRPPFQLGDAPGVPCLGLRPVLPWRSPEAAVRCPRRGGSRPAAAASSSSPAAITGSPTRVRARNRSPGPPPWRSRPLAGCPGRSHPQPGASRMSNAAATARDASSSWAFGTPKTAITASPRLLVTAPP